MPNITNCNLLCNVVFPSRDVWEYKLLRANKFWFVDGSKTDEDVGTGIYLSNQPGVTLLEHV